MRISSYNLALKEKYKEQFKLEFHLCCQYYYREATKTHNQQ